MHGKKDSPEYICLVDEKGRFLKEEDKETCHRGEGLLHSAFLVMVFNSNKELLLTQRSALKTLWPGFWDGSVASHYHRKENRAKSVEKRLKYEIGLLDAHFEYLFNFQYHAKYKDIGSEYEICDVYRALDINKDSVLPNSDEISEIKYMNLRDLHTDIKRNPEEYCPWLILALDKYLQSQP